MMIDTFSSTCYSNTLTDLTGVPVYSEVAVLVAELSVAPAFLKKIMEGYKVLCCCSFSSCFIIYSYNTANSISQISQKARKKLTFFLQKLRYFPNNSQSFFVLERLKDDLPFLSFRLRTMISTIN